MGDQWINAIWILNALLAAATGVRIIDGFRTAPEFRRLRALIVEAVGVATDPRSIPVAARVYGSLLPLWIGAGTSEGAGWLGIATAVWLLTALFADRWEPSAVAGGGLLFLGLGRIPGGGELQLALMVLLMIVAVAEQRNHGWPVTRRPVLPTDGTVHYRQGNLADAERAFREGCSRNWRRSASASGPPPQG